MGLLLAVQEGIPFAADPTPVSGRAVLTAFIVVALLGALAWYLRQRLPSVRGRQVITIDTAVSLGERRSLVIVTVENRRLLLGMTPQQVSLVTELGVAGPSGPASSSPSSPSSASSPGNGASFQQTLQASLDAGGHQS